jgi:hypothetical protein
MRLPNLGFARVVFGLLARGVEGLTANRQAFGQTVTPGPGRAVSESIRSSFRRGAINRVPAAGLIVIVATLLAGLLSSRTAWAQLPPPPASAQPSPAPSMSQETWRASMSRAPMPQKGCFKATYPNTEWQPVPCKTAPPVPYPPASGPRSDNVGNGNDYAAQVSGLISSAVGSFSSVTGVTSESGDVDGVAPPVANTFSLQLNANFFTTSVCDDAKTPSKCSGWQQFVYSNSGFAFMQYWLLDWGTTCPAGWFTYEDDCYTNSSSVEVPAQTIANLANLTLTGNAAAGGLDTITLWTGTEAYSASGEDSVVNLAAGWQDAEFNIFGDCCGTQAIFNSGSSLAVTTSVADGTTNAPSCEEEGFTGETNNLNLVAPCSPIGGASPAIVFTESLDSGGSPTPTPATPTPATPTPATPTPATPTPATPTPTPTPLPTTVLTVSPAKLNFGNIDATASSKAKKLTLHNTSKTVAAVIGQLAAPPSFTISSDGCSNQTIQPRKNCTVEVAFVPATVIGSVSETLTIPYNGASPAETLEGNGIAATLKAPSSKTLPSADAGSVGRTANITIRNSSTATVQLGAASALTDFTITDDGCTGSTLAPKASCVVSVEFAPADGTSGELTSVLGYDFTYGANSGGVAVTLKGKVK